MKEGHGKNFSCEPSQAKETALAKLSQRRRDGLAPEGVAFRVHVETVIAEDIGFGQSIGSKHEREHIDES